MARRIVGKLTARQVATAKPPRGKDEATLGDGGNLILQLKRSERGGHITKSWTFRFEQNGKRHEMGIGPVHTVPLALAREKAKSLRQQLLDGVNPLEARRAQRQAQAAEAAKRVTFKECAAEYMAAHSAAWRHPKHLAQWRSSLENYAYPVLGNLAVSEIEIAHVMRALEPIWKRIPETASRTRARVENVLGYATVRGFRSGDNPAQWRGRLATLLPSKRKLRAAGHFRAVAYPDLPALMAKLRGQDGVSARAVEFMVYTVCRSGELLGATWETEIDMKARTWAIPAHRMKSRRPHRIPLSPAAMAVLARMPRHGERVFPIHDGALRDVLHRLKVDGTPHGLRAAFRTWCAEQTAFPHEVCEQALAHAIPDAVVRAYKRTDLFDRRRKLMDQWSAFLAKPAPAVATVTPIRAAQ